MAPRMPLPHAFKPGNKAATVNKGKKKKNTVIRDKLKEKLGTKWEDTKERVQDNIIEFLTTGSRKERMTATRFFAEFLIPKKREQVGELKGTINLNIIYNEIPDAEKIDERI